MISGNRRIPLVYSNQKAKDPVYMKYSPGSSRTVRIACICTPPALPPPLPTEVFYRYYFNGSAQVKYATIIYVDPVSIKISVTDTYGVDQTLFLQAMSTATTMTLTSVITPSITWNLTINSTTNDSNYWTYYYTLASYTGVLTDDEQIKITYS